MAVSLTTADGLPAIEIPSADGELKVYALRVEAGPGRWSCVQSREGGPAYRVFEQSDRWSCTCPAFLFSRRGPGKGCKHTDAVKELRRVLDALLAPAVGGFPP